MSDEKIKAYGLTNQQGHLLGIINNRIESGNEISRRFLEEVMHLRGPSVTSLLHGLEEKGYIQRTVSNCDRRCFSITVTPKGKALVKEIHNVFLETELKLQEGMTPEEREILKDLLIRLYLNIPHLS
ncbi:MAG TPA: MarR family transcriptional regulator [Candidatus Merdenecus merdavium]|nr:MarR family transcriptional regulator [Candidatus Merdenecus merdavium]